MGALATPRLAQVNDTVTVVGGSKLYKVTEVDALYDGELARIWPADEDDEQPGQWIGRDLLRVQPQAAHGSMA